MKEFFKFTNKDSETEAELSIYDEISFWGVRAKDFHESLKGIKAKKLKVEINSPGGDVVDGYAIYNMLRAFKGEVEVTVTGIAASIASVIAMAGKRIKMPENALMFIHNPMAYVGGDSDELKKVAEDLAKLKDGILGIYEARTGSDRAKISAMMDEETLLTAKEAKLLGFADEILPENRAAAKSNFKWEDYQPTAKIPSEATTAAVGRTDNNKESTMTKEEQAALDAATESVRVLKGENAQLKTSVEEARNTAQQETATAESNRKKSIKDYAAKYNKDGDLNDAVIEALAGDTTLDQFKDKVLEIVNNRPSKAAARKSGGEEGSDADLQKQYEACKTSSERQAFLAKNRAWARSAMRG